MTRTNKTKRVGARAIVIAAGVATLSAGQAWGNVAVTVTQNTTLGNVTVAYAGSLDPTAAGFTFVSDGAAVGVAFATVPEPVSVGLLRRRRDRH